MVESLRRVTVESLRTDRRRGPCELFQRIRLMREVPAIRGRTAENTARDAAMISAVLAERAGRTVDDLEVRVISAAVLAALQEAMLRWVEDEGQGADLEALINRTMDVLNRGLTL